MLLPIQKFEEIAPNSQTHTYRCSLTQQNLIHPKTAPGPTTRTETARHLPHPIRHAIHRPRIPHLLTRTIRLREQRHIIPRKRTLSQIRIRNLKTDLHGRGISIQNTALGFLQLLGIARDGGAAFGAADGAHAVGDAAVRGAGIAAADDPAVRVRGRGAAGAEGEVGVRGVDFDDAAALVAPVDGERDVHPVVGVCDGDVGLFGGELVAVAAAIGFAVLVEAFKRYVNMDTIGLRGGRIDCLR